MKNSVLLYVLSFFLASCGSEYDKLVDQELAKNVREDSLFLGVEMGMSRKDFYGHCWELNKEGVIRQGPNNLSVQYNIDSTELRYKGFMHFYPAFEEDTISVMPMQFTYEAFLPTDSTYYSDHLLLDVKGMLERWYGGNKFIYLEDNEGTRRLWVKVDGNRRIRVFKKDLRTVAADIMDLRTILSENSDK